MIIRDIDTDIDKQQIVVKYCRSMLISEECTLLQREWKRTEELEKVLELKVDLLQGYYLARPAAVRTGTSIRMQ